jgi:DNA mismatch endonuclease, patch repair protein
MKIGAGSTPMTDTFTSAGRTRVMSRIKSKNTRPELIVRKYLYSQGIRYRLHKKTLPGKPDIVVSKINTVLFVNGCFWHHHDGCKRSNWPKSNKDYWIPKIRRNIARDKKNNALLSSMGWKIITIWECEVGSLELHGILQEMIQVYLHKD